jgi:hypothetical protein
LATSARVTKADAARNSQPEEMRRGLAIAAEIDSARARRIAEGEAGRPNEQPGRLDSKSAAALAVARTTTGATPASARFAVRSKPSMSDETAKPRRANRLRSCSRARDCRLLMVPTGQLSKRAASWWVRPCRSQRITAER